MGQLTVFVGIYNGQKYLKAIFNQISNLLELPIESLIVDNFSSDDSWALITNYQETISSSKVKIIRNPHNLGGPGSVVRNLNEVHTPWLTFRHQDDIYLDCHFYKLIEVISKSPNTTNLIFSEMDFITNENNVVAKPKLDWFIKGADRYSLFNAMIRNHVISTPTAAFRLSQFKSFDNHWHTPVSLDTELFLFFIASGDFHYIDEVTVQYRHSPKSESGSISSKDKLLGDFFVLNRVVQSSFFSKFLGEINIQNLEDFIIELNESIKIRVGDRFLSSLLSISLLEMSGFKFNYDRKVLNDLLIMELETIGCSSTASYGSRVISNSYNALNDLIEIGIPKRLYSNLIVHFIVTKLPFFRSDFLMRIMMYLGLKIGFLKRWKFKRIG
jgi:glycosyltransferase involved in cell wall biosynthesis